MVTAARSFFPTKYFYRRSSEPLGIFFFRRLKALPLCRRPRLRRLLKFYLLRRSHFLTRSVLWREGISTAKDYRGRPHAKVQVLSTDVRYLVKDFSFRYFSKAYPFLRNIVSPPRSHIRRRQPGLRGKSFFNKQLFKNFYFGLRERQFARLVRSNAHYFRTALRMQSGAQPHLASILAPLESRLATVLLRSGFYTGPREIRQVLNHGFVLVNGNVSTKPSQLLRPGDTVTFTTSEIFRIQFRLVRLFRHIRRFGHFFRFPVFFLFNRHLEVSYSYPSIYFSGYPATHDITFPFSGSASLLGGYYRRLG